MLLAVRNGAITGAIVAGLVLLLSAVPALARGYPLALLPLLAAGPVAARGCGPRLPLLLARGFVAGLAAAAVAVAALVFATEVLTTRMWALVGPASYPPMPRLPQPDLLPAVTWPQESILLFLPPLSALLAVLYGALLAPPESGLVHALGSRVAAIRASLETKLVWVLLGLTVFAVALGWIGFSALEDTHLRGHRVQLMLDWSQHAISVEEHVHALVLSSTLPDPAARQNAIAQHAQALMSELDHLERAPVHPGIALGSPAVREFATDYQGHLDRIRATAAELVAAAGEPDEAQRLPRTREAAAATLAAQALLAQRLNADAREFHNQTDFQHHASLMALMALVGISALAGLLLGQAAALSITRPLSALAQQVARIGHGDFAPAAALRNRDEVGDLATRLNAMTAELERLYGAEREGRRTAEALNAQLSAKNAELESVRSELQEAKDLLEQRVAERTAELHDANEQLRQAQKMEAIGRLAGGVAHDFNNLLTVITGFNDLLRHQLAPTDPLCPLSDEIAKASERAATLTQQLLAVSRRQVLAPQTLCLNTVIGDMEGMLRRIIGEDIELATALDPDLALVRADPGQLQQVILNLVVNARDAMPRGGQLILETTSVDAGPDGPADDAPAVLLAVHDTGDGIPASTLPHIFEPFYTTKPLGAGTGLGLSTVYGVVRQSGGRIEVNSVPGKGTTFRILLPAAKAESVEPEPQPAPPAPDTGHGTILLVEDDDQLRSLARIVLETHGYQVLEAERADAALALIAEHAGAVDLVLTDVVMPGMGGAELAEQVVARHPGVAVLYMTGYADDAIGRHGVPAGGFELLHKPFTSVALLAKVAEVMGRHAPLPGERPSPS